MASKSKKKYSEMVDEEMGPNLTTPTTGDALTIERFGYKEYDRSYEAIPDETGHLENLLAEMKENFKSGQTKDIAFRLE